MRRLNRYLELSNVAVLVLLVSCVGSDITMDKIQFVERGISSSGLSSMLERKPHKVHTVVDPKEGSEYHVHMFLMQIGTERWYVPGYYIGDTYIPGDYETRAVHEEFAFLFFKDSLLFWGFLHEFARSHDPLVRRLAPLIIEMSRKENEKEYIFEIN